MDIHKHHLWEELSLPSCTASTLWSRPAGCISEGLPWMPSAFPWLSAHWPSPHHRFSPTSQHVSCQALSLPVVCSSAMWRLFSTHFMTEPVHCKITCCDFSWDCVSPWMRWRGPCLDKHSLCVRARGITFLRALIFFYQSFVCVCFFFVYLAPILLGLYVSVSVCRY